MSGWPSSSLLLREHQIQSLGTVALSLPQESFVNFAFWPRYYSLVGPELCEFAIALLNFSPKTVTNDRWQNVQRVLNETKTCHICRIDLFQACVKKTVSNPFTKMLAHWWRISPIMLCDTMKAFHHQRAGGLAWGTHKQEPLPSGRTFLQPFPSSTLRFPLPLLWLSLRFCFWKHDELTIWRFDFYRYSWSFKCKFKL